MGLRTTLLACGLVGTYAFIPPSALPTTRPSRVTRHAIRMDAPIGVGVLGCGRIGQVSERVGKE